MSETIEHIKLGKGKHILVFKGFKKEQYRLLVDEMQKSFPEEQMHFVGIFK